MVAFVHLSVDGGRRLVDLVASAIVVVLSSHEETLTVAALTISGPREDVDEGFSIVGFVGPIDPDRATALRLAGRDVRLCDMTVLEILHGDVSTRSDRELRVLLRVVRCALIGVAGHHLVCDAGATGVGIRAGELPLVGESIKSGIGA